MKTIILESKIEKDLVIGTKVQDLEITTAELIRTAVNSPVSGGFTSADMINRIRILDFLSMAEKKEVPQGELRTLELEDADYANLTQYVKNTKWSIISRTIVEFAEQFK